jgi:hypothetical protein
MLILVAAAALLLCLDGTAHGQVDTSRPRPPARGIQLLPDSIRASDIEAIEIVKGPIGVDRLGAAQRRKMLETLEAQRRVWADRRPRTYVIRTVEIGHCMAIARRKGPDGEVLRDQLVVRDTTVVDHRLVPIAAHYAQQCHLAWRVEDVFADVARALADTMTHIYGLGYDAAYGFPRSYWLDYGSPYVPNSRPAKAARPGRTCRVLRSYSLKPRRAVPIKRTAARYPSSPVAVSATAAASFSPPVFSATLSSRTAESKRPIRARAPTSSNRGRVYVESSFIAWRNSTTASLSRPASVRTYPTAQG